MQLGLHKNLKKKCMSFLIPNIEQVYYSVLSDFITTGSFNLCDNTKNIFFYTDITQ